jgi:arsenate reductase (glutaredoxin)
MIRIYHNSRCKKSRAGLQYLTEKTSDLEIIEYLKDAPFTFESLKNVLKTLGKAPSEIIRTQEEIYKKEIKGKDLSDDELIRLMVENPKLIHRPIIVSGSKGVLGDPVAAIDQLFDQ